MLKEKIVIVDPNKKQKLVSEVPFFARRKHIILGLDKSEKEHSVKYTL